MSALVLDGELKSALAIVRSLGERGISVHAGSERATAMALHSRYVSSRFTYPSPYTNEEGFISAILKEAIRHGDRPVVYACSDVTYLAIYKHRNRLEEHVELVFPDARAIEIAFDKAITYSLARVSGVPTITTYTPANQSELNRVAETLAYPAVLKPRKSVTVYRGKKVFGSARFVHSKEELVKTYESMHSLYGESPLIQERLIGEEYGVEMIVHEGVPYALVTHHRLRSLSPTGGASVLKETVAKGALRDILETYARKIVEELRWTGPIMVEFKVDSDTMTPKLMEVNGRFWGSLPLSLCAGVDMPFYYYHLVTKKAFPREMVTQKDGVVSRHFWGDVRHLTSVIFGRSKMRRYAFPSRRSALSAFFNLPPGTHGDVWSLRDPKPAMMECIDIFARMRR